MNTREGLILQLLPNPQTSCSRHEHMLVLAPSGFKAYTAASRDQPTGPTKKTRGLLIYGHPEIARGRLVIHLIPAGPIHRHLAAVLENPPWSRAPPPQTRKGLGKGLAQRPRMSGNQHDPCLLSGTQSSAK